MGAIFIIASYCMYLVDQENFVKAKSWILFFPFLILLFKTGTDARRHRGGFIGLTDVFKEMYSAAIIGTVMCTTFEYFMYNIIDPDIKIILKEMAGQSMDSMGGWMTESMADEFKSSMEERDMFNISYSITQLVIRLLIPCTLFSFLMAQIIKRDKPITS